MNKHVEAGFKKIKLFWDAYKIIIGIIAILSGLGITGYATYEPDEPQKPLTAPVIDKVDSLTITHINPDYALKIHTHQVKPQPEPEVPKIDFEPMINRAVEAYARKHDPQGLGH